MASVFTQIIQGKLPCHQIWEDSQTLSFLSTSPVSPGHTLVVPKVEIDSFLALPPQLLQQVMHHAHTIGPAIHRASGKGRLCLAVQGFEVPHFHLHLIACDQPSEFDFTRAQPAEEAQLQAMGAKIRSLL